MIRRRLATALRTAATCLHPLPPAPRMAPVIVRISAPEATATSAPTERGPYLTDAAVTQLHLTGLQTAATWIELHAARCSPLTARELCWLATQLRDQVRLNVNACAMGDA